MNVKFQRQFPRWFIRLCRVALVLLALSLLGAAFEWASEASDARAHPPPGQMVDVGGYRLHIHCAGEGSPTVLIEAGLGDWSASWDSWVQPGLASTTRVCTYDRAGLGFSDAGPLPRTAERMVNELRTALDEARIPGPFVVVGHSLGGLVVRVFADRYASDIAGVVLIDSMNSSEAASPAADTPAAASSDPVGDWIITSPARIGVLRLLAGPLDLQADLSPEVAPVYVAYSVTPRFVQTTVDESRGLPESLAQAGAVTSLGSVPLTVLTRGVKADETWQRQQTELLKLSSNSQQIIASMSGHNIQLDQPQAAVDAVMKMVESVRGHTPVTQRLYDLSSAWAPLG